MTRRTGKQDKVFVNRTKLPMLLMAAFWLVSATVYPALAQPSTEDTVRFLQQATFGPSPDLIAHVQSLGSDNQTAFSGYLAEQFGLPVPDYPDDSPYWPESPDSTCNADHICVRDNYQMYQTQLRFYTRALTAPDQLRQRVAFALNQILVISAQHPNLVQSHRMRPYLTELENDAFGNFRNLLYDITLNPGMGRYLDMVGNNKSNPNENYAREILQLFSIGLNLLNPDGTPQLDVSGSLIPTYDQSTITNFARVFTGWTFAGPPQTGITNYFDPMVVNANAHDTGVKTLLDYHDGNPPVQVQSDTATELNQALDDIFNHPNVGPFICKQLIERLVASNPSSGYVSRVVAVFNNDGTGTRGNLQAVIQAILLDDEARNVQGSNDGHLKEPVLWITNLLRAFQTGVSDNSTTDFVLGESYIPSDIRMDQDLFRSPTVFNFYPPDYQIPGDANNLIGPEFAILSTATSLARDNFAYEVVFKQMPTSQPDRPTGTWLDPAVLAALPSDPNNPSVLVNYLNSLMLAGAMNPATHDRIVTEMGRYTDPVRQAQEAVYLIATSSEYWVQR
jgi:uncharacterized protein (DUF1800 family)